MTRIEHDARGATGCRSRPRRHVRARLRLARRVRRRAQPMRRMLGLDVEGVFQDRFLIADVVMKADFPAERWFWFDPPFHRGQSVLLHREADNVWRIDFQLGWDADPEAEKAARESIRASRRCSATTASSSSSGSSVYAPSSAGAWRSATGACCSPAMPRRSRRSARAAPTPASRTPTTWAGSSSRGRGRRPGAPAGHLQRRRVYAADENPQLDALDRLHHAQERGLSPVPQRGAGPRARARLRASLVNSGRLSVPAAERVGAEHAGRRHLRGLDGASARRWTMRRSDSAASRLAAARAGRPHASVARRRRRARAARRKAPVPGGRAPGAAGTVAGARRPSTTWSTTEASSRGAATPAPAWRSTCCGPTSTSPARWRAFDVWPRCRPPLARALCLN